MQAIHAIHSTMERIKLHPKFLGNGLYLELYGELANILAACEGAKMQNAPGSKASGRLSVVAGTRSHLYRTTLRWCARA